MASVLVVEDDFALADMIAEFLGLLGYSVHIAPNVRSALNLLVKYNYAFLIVDGQLPDKDGPWLVKKVKSHQPHLPIIGISGKGYFQAFSQAGAEAYLPKPFTLHQLKQKITILLPLL